MKEVEGREDKTGQHFSPVLGAHILTPPRVYGGSYTAARPLWTYRDRALARVNEAHVGKIANPKFL